MEWTKAVLTEIPQLIEMRIAYLTEDYHSLTLHQQQAIRGQLPEYFAGHLNKDLIVFVAREEKTIVATAFLLVTHMPANPSAITGRFGTMLNVYTKPEYRRQGISRKLVSMALEYARKEQLSYVDWIQPTMGLRSIKAWNSRKKYPDIRQWFINFWKSRRWNMKTELEFQPFDCFAPGQSPLCSRMRTVLIPDMSGIFMLHGKMLTVSFIPIRRLHINVVLLRFWNRNPLVFSVGITERCLNW